MKRCYVILAAVWMMLGLAWAHDALAGDADGTPMYIQVADGFHITARRNPDRDSSVEMRLLNGTPVTVVGIRGDWAEIEGGEAGTAWCRVGCLTDYDPTGDTQPTYTVVSNGKVRVRSTPNGKTVGYVHNGDVLQVRFVFDGWAYIGEKDGYIMTEFLERNEINGDEE